KGTSEPAGPADGDTIRAGNIRFWPMLGRLCPVSVGERSSVAEVLDCGVQISESLCNAHSDTDLVIACRRRSEFHFERRMTTDASLGVVIENGAAVAVAVELDVQRIGAVCIAVKTVGDEIQGLRAVGLVGVDQEFKWRQAL